MQVMKHEEIVDLWEQAHIDCDIESVPYSKQVIEAFVELIVDKCADSVIDSDPSEKLVLHEPYRTVMDNVLRTFNDEDS